MQGVRGSVNSILKGSMRRQVLRQEVGARGARPSALTAIGRPGANWEGTAESGCCEEDTVCDPLPRKH